MKITKEQNNLLEMETNDKVELDLREAVEDGEETLADVDLNDSTSDIANAIQNEVENATDNKKTVSDTEAEKTADQLKQIDNQLDGKTEITFIPDSAKELETVNAFSKKLDKALQEARKGGRQGRGLKANILCVGLPGSGKTAIFDSWAKSRGVAPLAIDAKDPDLPQSLYGMQMRDIEAGGNKITKAYSNLLTPLDRPNSVLFLDEFNRAGGDLRGTLLQLINEHYVPMEADLNAPAGSPESAGRRYFDNLLFCVACVNPALDTDPGAQPLNDAELSRFGLHVDFNSTPEAAIDFFEKHYTKLILKLDKSDKYYLEDLEEYLREEDIVLFLLNSRNPVFEFDTVDDTDDLHDYQKVMLNQRMLTNLISLSDGDVEEFKDLVKSSRMLDRDIDMILSILDNYKVPTLSALIANKNAFIKGLGISSAEELDIADPNQAGKYDPQETGEIETDSLFGNGNSKHVVGEAEARRRIEDLLKTFKSN